MSEQRLIWVGASIEDIRRFPPEARRRAGYELHQVQSGLEPTHWKPMPAIGAGVREIRIETGRAFRVIYLARLPDAIAVLHVFEKRSAQTARMDIALARARLRRLALDPDHL